MNFLQIHSEGVFLVLELRSIENSGLKNSGPHYACRPFSNIGSVLGLLSPQKSTSLATNNVTETYSAFMVSLVECERVIYVNQS